MAYQVLYRTYRPSCFKEVVGQDYIVKTLKNAIETNKIAHAYLFAGPRGTGKTSVAKLFGKAINCDHFKDEACDNCPNCKAYLEGNHPDIIEMDAASNNGVENIREIVEQVNYAPLLGKYKIYIIDEVHMLSTSAFNALLKTLEEPPSHVIFILATTDPQKIIPTVLSRCQRYNFSKIRPLDISKQLKHILDNEKLKYDDNAIEEISRLAEGGLRDGLSILEQCLSYNREGVYLEDVKNIFGLSSTRELIDLLIKVHNNEISESINTIRDMYNGGIDLKRLVNDLLEIIKEVLIYSDRGSDKLLNRIKASEAQEIINIVNKKDLFNDASYLEETLNKDRQNQNFLLYLELCLVKMASNNSKKENKVELIKEETKQKEEKELVKLIDKEEIFKEEIIESIEVNDLQEDLMLSILLNASKEEKINDEIIYNRLDLYRLEVDKRKFYELLNGTGIFASCKDAIIIHGNDSKIDSINEKDTNEDIYRFINEEFGIDKMIYGIKKDELNELVEKYKKAKQEGKNISLNIKKYELPKEETKESKIKNMFGNINIED